MIKYFCDQCKTEITRDIQFDGMEFKVGNHLLSLRIEDPMEEHFCICKYCAVDEVVKILDDRPKQG